MIENSQKAFVRTTLYIPKRLHDAVKLMGVYTHTNMSRIMCIALREKMEKMHGKEFKDLNE